MYIDRLTYSTLNLKCYGVIVCDVKGACVQNVLDSLIPALLADKNRRFIYVEQVIVLVIFGMFSIWCLFVLI